MTNPVDSLKAFDDGSGTALYAGGRFTTAGGVPANRIAKWDGTQWSPLGEGANGIVNAMAVFDDGSGDGPALFAGGYFSLTPDRYIGKWKGCPTEPACEHFADLNCDGVIGVTDLQILLGAWGSCAATGCPADLDGNGIVGVGDLLLLLTNWG